MIQLSCNTNINPPQAYVTDIDSRTCYYYPINWPFVAHDIPADAVFEGYESIGSYPDYVTLSQWIIANASSPSGVGHRYMTFTSQGCVPVRDDFFNNATGFSYMEFSDVTLGLHDPNIFVPPTGCKPAPPPPKF
ncbi:MAG: hypothetical protein B7X84_03595 [Alphaproteobacteria bacterium 17-39-52]|nr:MAG: hypothetical protein B7X84_03595 [Alphaproteobacteria bacterium 17-39-52]